MTQEQTAFTARIVGVFLQYLAKCNGLFNVGGIQIFLKPLLLSVNAEFVFPRPDPLLDIRDIHRFPPSSDPYLPVSSRAMRMSGPACCVKKKESQEHSSSVLNC
jgi:hypothetical protein